MKRVILIILVVLALVAGSFLFLSKKEFWFKGGGFQQKFNVGTGTVSTLIFTGDIMLGRSVEIKLKQYGDGDYFFPFARISEWLNSADLTIANLEGPVSDRGIKVGSIYSFRFNPLVVKALKKAGFDVVSLANNHIWDYGKVAFLDTLDNLKNGGIDYVGAGKNFAEAHAGVTKELNGTRITFLAYTPLLAKSLASSADHFGINVLDLEQMDLDIKSAKAHSDLVVVSFHFGEEYQPKHNQFQATVAHRAVDAGADLIIGHHPHVAEDLEEYKGKWIAYSLGNFVFDQYFSPETMQGMVLRVTLTGKKISEVEPLTVQLNSNYQPAVYQP